LLKFSLYFRTFVSLTLFHFSIPVLQDFSFINVTVSDTSETSWFEILNFCWCNKRIVHVTVQLSSGMSGSLLLTSAGSQLPVCRDQWSDGVTDDLCLQMGLGWVGSFEMNSISNISVHSMYHFQSQSLVKTMQLVFFFKLGNEKSSWKAKKYYVLRWAKATS